MTDARVRRTREEQREETRRRLLDAAQRTFIRRGYEATSIEEIAEAAGYTRGAVYSNFRDKDDLYVTVLEERMAAKADEIRAAAAGTTNHRERIDALRTFFVNEPEDAVPILYAELQLAAARHPGLRRTLRALFERHLASCLAAVIGGPVDANHFRTAFVTMFAVIEGTALQRASGNASIDDARTARRIVFDAVCPVLETYFATQDATTEH